MLQNIKVSGTVITGENIGHTIGYPTANINALPNESDLKLGVYLAKVKIDNQEYYGLAYFGPRLIFGETKLNFEVYIFNFSQNIYDQQIEIEILDFIRAPQAFTSLNQLKNALQADEKKARVLIDSTFHP